MNFKKALFLSIALLSTAGLMNAMAPRNIIMEETASGIRYTDPNSNQWVEYNPTSNQYFGRMPGSELAPRMHLEIEPEEYGRERFLEVKPKPTGTQTELRQLYNSLKNRYSPQNPNFDSEAFKYKALFDESGERIK